MRRALLLLLSPWLVAGCALRGAAGGCDAASRPMTADTLFLGTAAPDGTVSAQAWRAFLQDAVTPRFPQGFSWWPAQGQWRGDDGRVLQEASYVLQVVHTGSEAELRAIGAIAAAYKARFRQEAVLRSRVATCVSF